MANSFEEQAKQFEAQNRVRFDTEMKEYNQFLQRFPFKETPQAINSLTPERVYQVGTNDHFFYWVERKLKYFGHLNTRTNRPFLNAAVNFPQFKTLLHIAVDESKSIASMIDAPWDNISGFGGDRMIAKKIISLFNLDRMIPVLTTPHFEGFANNLGIEFHNAGRSAFSKAYGQLTIGQKFEHLNALLLRFKRGKEVCRDWNNTFFMRFLHERIGHK